MLKLFLADLKLLVRNRQVIFWSFAFPLLFTVIFGFFFSGNANSAGTVAFIDNAHTEFSGSLHDVLKDQKAFTLKDETSVSDVQDNIKNGKEAGAVIIPEGFGTAGGDKVVKVLYDPGSPAAQASIEGVVSAFLTQASFQAQHAQPLYSISDEATGKSGSSYFDYVLIGLLGMALMNSAIQGIAISMTHYKEQQILKRITTTPLSPWKFILAEVLARLCLSVVQMVIILGIGIYGFHSTVSWSVLPAILGVAIVGAIMFQLIGFAIAALSKTADAAQGMSQSITIPMMFLGGVFFPVDGLPSWLRAVVQFLPLAPLLRTMRAIALQGGKLFDNPAYVAIVLGWIVVLLIFVRYRFKLSEE